MSFEQLRRATQLHSTKTLYFGLVEDWHAKRDKVLLCLDALPVIASGLKLRVKKPYELNPKISIEDQLPRLNLEIVCEGTLATYYAMSEIAARFANHASDQALPASFNDIRQRTESGRVESALIAALGDLQWYKKVREIRTEWTHFSNIFIGEDANGDPLLVLQDKRRMSDKMEFKAKSTFGIPDLIQWVRQAISTIDAFGDYLLRVHVLPKFDLSVSFTSPQYDRNGMPIINPNGVFAVEKITVGEYLRRAGVL